MKRIISAVFIVLMFVAMSTTAFASYKGINQDVDNESQNTNLTLSIAPTYTISIPADANINFNETSTPLGTVNATNIKIEPNKNVVVSAVAGELKNQKDTNKTLKYKLMNGKEEFSSISLNNTEEKADLSVTIEEEDWNKAYAGDYKGIITFTISYEDSSTN